MKITVVGIGYVGLSLATLLSFDNEVVLLDIDEEKVNKVNNKMIPIKDSYIEDYFYNKNLSLSATLNYKEAFKNSNFIIIATSTNYNDKTNKFDTSSIEDVIVKAKQICDATIIIKSTVPVGFTDYIKNKYNMDNIVFSPEFLREGKALYDNLYPTRIIVGDKSNKAKEFGNLLKKASLKKDTKVLYMSNQEAESVKLFSNAYLALRVAFFNELDSFAEKNELNSKSIINGVCGDPRIGNYYNNPSFGYGGYCLPKDTKQLLSEYKDVPQSIIKSIVESNDVRKNHIVDMIISKGAKVIGIYRLSMKTDSDNSRESSIIDIINKLKEKDLNVVIYEPNLNTDTFNDLRVINDFKEFESTSDIIVANRYDEKLKDVKARVYTRDVFKRD